MSNAWDAARAKTELGGDLAEGIKSLSLNQKITFTLYVRAVLPLDGYVFWLRSDLLATPPISTEMAAAIGTIAKSAMQRPTLEVQGSLHYATDTRQEEAETYAANRMVFTSLTEIQELNAIAPNLLYIGEFQGQRFGFSTRSSFYRQADLYHYVGFAVYPDMETQLIDEVVDFDTTEVIVTNSLPAWLALNTYDPPYGFSMPAGLTLFPSFLSPQNIDPPFGTVHIVPETTRGLAMAPYLTKTSSHSQLCAERVRVTLWGTRNDIALDFIDCVNQYSLDTAAFGLTNVPTMRDEKRTQSELAVIGMKKTVDFDITYHQYNINDIARQLIVNAIPNFYISAM
jgi:hypothetical protein